MNPQELKIKPVKFSEHPIVDIAQLEPSKYDISSSGLQSQSSFILNGDFLINAYCEAILTKVLELCKSEILDFLEYQCFKLTNPLEWLDNLENLIDINSGFFNDECKRSKLNKLEMNVLVCRANLKHTPKPIKKQLVNWEEIIPFEKLNKFDINIVKFDLTQLNTFYEKKAYLVELKADFLQSENICSVSANKSFGTLIDIELEKLEALNQIPVEAKVGKFAFDRPTPKMRINGNANVLVDIFHRLHYEYKTDGKPYIDNTPTEIANMIVGTFLGKEGKKLSLSTVQSTLSPSKIEKRPSCDKRFCMRHLDKN
jgi:hypothetical protein